MTDHWHTYSFIPETQEQHLRYLLDLIDDARTLNDPAYALSVLGAASKRIRALMGWRTGLEPATTGFTNQDSTD